jgi:signal transduction histidine kinase/AmiR/NasT family two-component response regulator
LRRTACARLAGASPVQFASNSGVAHLLKSARSPDSRKSLRNLTLAVLLAAFAVMACTQFFIGRSLYTDAVTAAEEREAVSRMRHAQAVLQQSAAGLLAAAADYGVWEDTHDYMTGRYPDYATNNFYTGTFERLKIDAVLLIDLDGALRLDLRADGGPELRALSVPERISLSDERFRQRVRTAQRPISGYAVVGGAPYLYAAARIRPTDASRPSAGHVVFLRALDVALLTQYAEALDAAVEVRTTRTGAATTRVPVGPARLEDLQINSRVGDRLETKLVIGRSHAGEIIELFVTTPRPLLSTVRRASNYFLASSLLGGLIVAWLALAAFDRRLLGPLAELAARLRHIGARGEFDERVRARDRNDEIADVVRSVNRMLDDLASKRDAERARDAALDASRLKSEFLATMSHEIRTPMNGVLGMLELVERSDLSAQQRERVSTARDSAEALLVLLNDILDLSRLEAGRMVLDATATDLGELVARTCQTLTARADEKGVELKWRIDGELTHGYRVDAGRLRQILLNLAGNAVKFTERGRVEVVLSRRALRDDADLIRMDVIDTGIGIEPGALGTVFEAFTQANASTTRRFGGSGLGLSISRQLATLMGGTLTVQSELRRGSTFSLTLPLQTCALPARAALQVRTPEGLGLRVLVAEDNRVNQLVVSAMLERLACAVDIVADGEQAIAHYQRSYAAYDAILMDVNMPLIDGYTAATRIREFEAGLSHPHRVPILALTANAMAGDRERCLQHGMDGYLSKPIALAALEAGLRGVTQRGASVEAPRAARASIR